MSTHNMYEPTVANPGLVFRIWNRVAGFRDRNGVLGQFYKENNITSANLDNHVLTRSKYFIETHHLERLANIRDREIDRGLSKLESLQPQILADIKAYQDELKNQQDILAYYDKQFQDVEKKLKDSKNTSLQKAHLQGLKGTIEASRTNQQMEVDNYSNHIDSLQSLYRNNIKSFKDVFLKEVKSKYESLKGDYLKYAGAKLLTIGFTKYDAQYRELSDETLKRIEALRGSNGI